MKIKNLDTANLSDYSLQKLINVLVNERAKRGNAKLMRERRK